MQPTINNELISKQRRNNLQEVGIPLTNSEFRFGTAEPKQTRLYKANKRETDLVN